MRHFQVLRNKPNAGTDSVEAFRGVADIITLGNVYFDQCLWMVSGFVQDGWKLTPRLTVNLGLRYDFATPPWKAKTTRRTSMPVVADRCSMRRAGRLAIAPWCW